MVSIIATTLAKQPSAGTFHIEHPVREYSSSISVVIARAVSPQRRDRRHRLLSERLEWLLGRQGRPATARRES